MINIIFEKRSDVDLYILKNVSKSKVKNLMTIVHAGDWVEVSETDITPEQRFYLWCDASIDNDLIGLVNFFIELIVNELSSYYISKFNRTDICNISKFALTIAGKIVEHSKCSEELLFMPSWERHKDY